VTEALRHANYEGHGEEEEEGGEEGAPAASMDAEDGGEGAEAEAASLGSPTVVLQPRSMRKAGSFAAQLHDAAEEEDKEGNVPTPDSAAAAAASSASSAPVFEFGGVSVALDGCTPNAVRRGRRMGQLGTPAAAPMSARSASAAMLPGTAAPTPAGHAAGTRAPAPTPLRPASSGGMMMGEDEDGEEVGEGTGAEMAVEEGGVGASTGAGAAPAAADGSRAVSRTRVRVGGGGMLSSSSAAASAMASERQAPASMQPARRSARVAGSAVAAPRAQSALRLSGRGRLVSPVGFVHERSPKGKVLAEAAAKAAEEDGGVRAGRLEMGV
jgi:hypothetical protein